MTSTKKERADLLLVVRGLVSSRERARAAILAGNVFCSGVRVTKAGQQLALDADLTVRQSPEYVSRGGLKLAGALDSFGVPVQGKICVDVGASTGGFTDVLLKRGAVKVYAIDVGYGQLAWSLRSDSRVIVMERTNVRNLAAGALAEEAELLTVDVSFISLKKIMRSLAGLLAPDGDLVALVKPQFEGERSMVGKGGVVRDRSAHVEILRSLMAPLASEGLVLKGLTHSPIQGADGNIEYWLHAARSAGPAQIEDEAELIEAVVHSAHSAFSR